VDQLRGETAQVVSQQLESVPSRISSTFLSQKDFRDSWAEFRQAYNRDQAEERRAILALRQDLETVVIEADSRLEQTRHRIGQLAAAARPATPPSALHE
jgi:hypothetical protein